MSLPPSFFDDLRSRTSLAAVVARKVTWDNRKSNPGKGDMWAPCPFHQEKSASFHVDDRKGFYYCFGCHAKGDAIGFVKETENVSFMEAVEILAREAGMQMPERDPRAAERAEKRAGLSDIMEMAVKFYRAQLSGARAGAAREYINRRGLTRATVERFEIGYAPPDRTLLFEHLRAKGIEPAEIVASGVAAQPDSGQPYDRFRDRIIFPIRDGRGRAISLGGRAMDPNARAKYLNGPETELFDKGRALYNQGPAREAAGKTQALVVAEGYMDVIALAQAGIGHAVAPLGTAITEGQLALMWRITDEPVIALDGDTAGIRAARRLIDVALPLLQPGKSLRFCVMPAGQDPDDLIRESGVTAMQSLLDGARPMVELLWERETEGKVFDSPERRAALDADLRRLLNNITDQSIRTHYGAALRDKRQELFGGSRPSRGGFNTGTPWRPKGAPEPASAGARASFLARETQALEDHQRLRESAIMAGCLNHPEVARSLEAPLERLPMACSDLTVLRDVLLYHLSNPLHHDASTAVEATMTQLGYDARERLNALGNVRVARHLLPQADASVARAAILEEMAKQTAEMGIRDEVRDAEEDMHGVADEGVTWRLQQASIARDRALRGLGDEEDTASGGEQELSDHLSRLIADQVWIKKR
ncbi:DNA primase [Monaibacterium marinum]|uniref:DNA primase n=1 Tax=Pontivivens marinum TaxID=1690039 RepID=A0A2C9CMP9_9RHOB|nr:DNA primase [Monaibacterium marinum]SOH92450.1 DNA primase [Monaibacterium marinum]